MKRILIFLATFWVAIYNNSRIRTDAPTYDVFCIFKDLSKFTRIAEIGVLLVIFIAVISSTDIKNIRKVLVSLLVFFGISVLGIVASPSNFLVQVQGVFVYIGPIIFFICAYGAGINSKDIDFLLNFYFVYTLVNIVATLLYVVPTYQEVGDINQAFFSDAHVFGTFVALISCMFFYKFLISGKSINAFYSLALMAFSFIPSNEKMILFNFLAIVILLIYSYRINPAQNKALLYGMGGVGIVGSVILYNKAIAFIDSPDVGLRITDVVEVGLANLGFVNAWPIALKAIGSSVLTFVFGLGSGNYGGIAAGRFLAEGSDLSAISQSFYEQLVSGEGLAGAFNIQTNTWSNLLAEYGISGFVVFTISIYAIVRMVNNASQRSPRFAELKLLFFLLFAALVFQGLITPYTNWGDTIFTYPMMFVGGYIVKSQHAQT